jgi:hypothetical protein
MGNTIRFTLAAAFAIVGALSPPAVAQDAPSTRPVAQTSKPLGEMGDSCRVRADCGPGLRCIANACRNRLEGTLCTSDPECGRGLLCLGGKCGTPSMGVAVQSLAPPPPTTGQTGLKLSRGTLNLSGDLAVSFDTIRNDSSTTGGVKLNIRPTIGVFVAEGFSLSATLFFVAGFGDLYAKTSMDFAMVLGARYVLDLGARVHPFLGFLLGPEMLIPEQGSTRYFMDFVISAGVYVALHRVDVFCVTHHHARGVQCRGDEDHRPDRVPRARGLYIADETKLAAPPPPGKCHEF